MRFPTVEQYCRSSSPRTSVDTSSIIVVTSLFLVALSVNLEVPFYSRYIQGTAYSHEVTGIIFAAYVAGLLPILLLLGGLSDRMGRKPIIVVGMTAAWGATLAVTIFPSLLTLFVARLLQGIGVGLSLGAGTAYLKERLGDQSARSAQFVTLMTTLGFGSGAILTSSLPMSPVALVPLSYWIVLVVTGCVLLLTLGLPESLQCRVQKPLLRLPCFPKGTLVVGGAMALAWAGAGLVITFLPVQLTQERLAGWAGIALFSALALFMLVMLLGNGLVIWKISLHPEFLPRSSTSKHDEKKEQ